MSTITTLSKEQFLQQYILTRVSHKKTPQELCKEALHAWDFIQFACMPSI